MYENGRQVNRYANKMKHKRVLKNRYRRLWFRGYTAASWEDYVAHAKEWDRLEYWTTYYLSGVKDFSRDRTNGNLRTTFREEKARGDYEAMHAPQHGEYRKYFDYWWTVY